MLRRVRVPSHTSAPIPYHSLALRNMELHLDLEIVDNRDGAEVRRPVTDRIVHLEAADNMALAEAIGRLFERHPVAYAGIKQGEKIEGRRAKALALLLPTCTKPPGIRNPRCHGSALRSPRRVDPRGRVP